MVVYVLSYFLNKLAKEKRSIKTCANLQISTSRSSWRPYLERLMVFGGGRMQLGL